MPTLAPVPNVVIVHAHPDDEAIFTGLLIRRLADHGGRVVLVTATGGEHGAPSPGCESAASVAAARLRELEDACEVLGVARLVLLGRRDSGLPGTAANLHPRALLRSRPESLAARVSRVAVAEGAAAIVHDGAGGIYGHPDHVTAHRIGAAAARMADVSSYEVTVDRERLGGSAHLVTRAAASIGRRTFGSQAGEIGIAVHGTTPEMAAKRAAMAAHASQIDPTEIAWSGFGRLYGREWLTRTRGPAVLEHLSPAALPAVPTQHPASIHPTRRFSDAR